MLLGPTVNSSEELRRFAGSENVPGLATNGFNVFNIHLHGIEPRHNTQCTATPCARLHQGHTHVVPTP